MESLHAPNRRLPLIALLGIIAFGVACLACLACLALVYPQWAAIFGVAGRQEQPRPVSSAHASGGDLPGYAGKPGTLGQTAELEPSATPASMVTQFAGPTSSPLPPLTPTGAAATAKATGTAATSVRSPKKEAGTPTSANSVRYGERTPNLPQRIVRVASADIKLDTKVYEVYVSAKGLWEVADYAAGHHYSSKNPGEGGNIILSGHNNWRGEVFRYLEFLKPGDALKVWTLEGKEYRYRVEQVQKVKEAGVPMAQRLENARVMDDTPYEQLTLITCWPYKTYTHRLIVIAKPVQ